MKNLRGFSARGDWTLVLRIQRSDASDERCSFPQLDVDDKHRRVDLSTTYLGMKLRTPLVPSASPLSEDVDKIRQMEQAGASAVVLHSLFEEEAEAAAAARREL